MKFLLKALFLFLLLTLPVVIRAAVQVTGPLSPQTPTATYPTHDAQFGKGGLMYWTNHTTVPPQRRAAVMIVFDTTGSNYWQLAPDLTTWTRAYLPATDVEGNLSATGTALNIVSNTAAGALPRTGGTMAGALVLAGNATANLNPVALQQLGMSNAALLAAALATNAATSNALAGNLTIMNNLVNAAVIATNGVAAGLSVHQAATNGAPLAVYDDIHAGMDNGYQIGNGYTVGGSGGNYPIAFFRPTKAGYSMPFDLMPNGTNADVWMDFCTDDIVPVSMGGNGGSALNYLDIRHRSIANGNYAEITTDAWGGRSLRPLIMQSRGGDFIVTSLSGTPMQKARVGATHIVLTSDNGNINQPFWLSLWPSATNGLGFDVIGTSVRDLTYDQTYSVAPRISVAKSFNWSTDGNTYPLVLSNGVTTIPAAGGLVVNAPSTFANTITANGQRINASSFMVSSDSGGSVFPNGFNFRMGTNANLFTDANLSGVRLSAVTDGTTTVPLTYSASSHRFTTDTQATYDLVVSNHVATVSKLAVTGTSTLISDVAASAAVVVGNATKTSSGAQIQSLHTGSSAILTEDKNWGGSMSKYFSISGGTQSFPVASTAANAIDFWFSGYDGVADRYRARLRFIPNSAWSSTSTGSEFVFSATPSGSTNMADIMAITGAGVVMASSGATTLSSSNALFEAQSTTQGSIPAPKMTAAQSSALNASEALLTWNLDDHKLRVFNGTYWYNTPQEFAASATLDFTSVVSLK